MEWMAWTLPTALFFAAVGVLLLGMTLLELRRPCVERRGFLPLVTHLPGFASYGMLDAGKGTLVTISGFTTSSGSAESTKAAAKYVKEHLAALVPGAPEVTSGEVKLLERAH